MKNRLILLMMSIVLLNACSSNKAKNQVLGKNVDNVKVVGLTSMRVNNLLNAKGYLHNIGNSTAQVYYRCLFFDVNQVPLGEPSAWKFATVYSPDYIYEDVSIKCQATDVNAMDFKIELSNSSSAITVYK